jgi:hypothetical protein
LLSRAGETPALRAKKYAALGKPPRMKIIKEIAK